VAADAGAGRSADAGAGRSADVAAGRSADARAGRAADTRPSVYILSDSLGETADAVAKAALSQFEEDAFHVVRLPRINSRGQLQGVVHGAAHERCVFLYTLAERRLRDEMAIMSRELDIFAIDILGPVVTTMEMMSGMEPEWEPGLVHRVDRSYFDRIEALEFAVKHDDGRATEELAEAEIVLIGVSRSSKTPIAMYLAFRGYKAANIPLVPGVPAPDELFDIDTRRIFGLTTSANLLVDIRGKRFSDIGSYAQDYFDREHIEQELDDSRALMRRLGCIVVSTEGRAVEETAQEILEYYSNAFSHIQPGAADADGHASIMPPATHSRPRRHIPRQGD
jgi:regulator of PEP synthase PpsR (kinase-PPPase family)